MASGKYVDGFLLAVPKNRVADYRKMAKEGAKAWKKFGALDYMECIGDDVTPKPAMGRLTFPGMIKLKKGEVVWFSYITFKSRAHRDAVNKKVMAHFEKKYTEKEQHEAMPFDMKRMAYGGFTVEVSS